METTTSLSRSQAQSAEIAGAWRRFMYLYVIALVALPLLALFVFSGPVYW